ncbi:hypothetical protein P3X46_018148 [Hevea brasiliensis]|uniref:CCHC-type domain-containing protein n=1 Tax=Hevea brasiliensis TaxID=3981 RepID=A0ABQ9LPX5_HEVBR|nr:hypothetical protein P3X46_018148 [Hevea brasiliensis]
MDNIHGLLLTNANRINNIHGLLQGKAYSWFDGIRRRIGVDLTWYRFVIEFWQDLSIREYVDRFEDLYGFVSEILASEEVKCDRFKQGLHIGIRSSMIWFRGSNFRELVEAALNIEKVRQEEKEYEQGQGDNSGFEQKKRTFPQCATSGKYYDGECRKFDQGCFDCGAPRHFKRDCPLLVTKDSGSGYGSMTPQNPHIGIAPA